MIKFENVVKRFGSRTILDDISYELRAGEILFALGRSGTGKSVMLKNIVGLMRPEQGRIWVDGQEVSRISEEEYFPVRRKCGMVFQHPALFDSLSVFENVAFGLRRHTRLNERDIAATVRRSLQHVNLEEGVEKKMPSEISYGMQKRVSLARTLALEPKVLLFDEPTTGLDPVTTNAVNQLILSLSRRLQTTSIVVSHDMRCALDIADRIIVLDAGKIIEDSTVDQLKRSQQPLVREFLEEVAV